MSTPSRTTPSRSTPAAPPRCSRAHAGPASSASSTRRRSGSTATPRTTTVSETTLLPPPAHLYTATKLAGELYCKSYQELYGINYTILRFGIPYGPRAREAAVIPAFVNKAFAGEPLTLSGDGMQSRRFVYVEDLAEGVVAGLGDIAENRVYNLSSDEDVTIKQIAELVQEIVGNTEIIYGPARPGDLGSKIVALGPRPRGARLDGVDAVQARASGATSSGGASKREENRQTAGGHPDPLALAGEPDEVEACPRKVLIISADIGEGHDLPARAIAREFKEEDPDAFDLGRQRSPRDGAVDDRRAARELGVHVPLGAVAVRPPVPAVHGVPADPLAGVAAADLRSAGAD